MPIIRKPAPGQLKADRMRMIYLRAEQQILKEITRKRNLGLVDYSEVAALQRVQQILRNMTAEAEEYAPVMIKMQFYGQEDFPSAPMGYENAGMLTTAQTSIVERLTENLMVDIETAAATAYESAEKFLALGRTEADRFRMLTLEEVARLEAEGKGWNTIQREMAAKLQAQGITCFVDKAGRKWGLTQYCSMATRTTQRQAQVAAALTADDWDLWQISKIGSTCPLCSTYEGRVYSKSGTDPDYPPLTMAFGKMDPAGMNDLSNSYLNIHPNCLHSLVRYTTAGKTDEQIQRDKDFSSFEKRPANVDYRTKKQQEAYRQKEAERAAFRRDMKQFNKYKAALGKDIPGFEAFRKNKINNTPKYQEWESKYKSFREKGANELANLEKSGIIKAESETTVKAAAVKIPDKESRAGIINEAIRADRPFYAQDLKTAYINQGVQPKPGCYDVMMHGTPFYTTYYQEYILDPETLSYIIAGRPDWKGSDIRLISCSTGKEDKYGNCIAKQIAKQLKVNVYAPIDDVYIVNGELRVGDDLLPENEGFKWFEP